MTKGELHDFALGLPGATFDVKWGADHVYSVGGKMFAATDLAGTSLGFKATDIAFEVLTETGRALPSKYLARAKWLTIEDLAAQDAAEVADWVRTSHALVAEKLPKKTRAALGIGG